ncbi:MAG: 1-deoxy-D-xylulose-5-phosphate synthase [Muribaculaceae bacterium]|nr:1-deoxy-D-xylulose-5-phosphate synthase [Muribaculaceae bacterium]
MEEIHPADPDKPQEELESAFGTYAEFEPLPVSIADGVTPLLASINCPADLRKLSPDQLPQVCADLRKYLIASLSENPGHFASSMGAVDIIVALHYVFNTPNDRIVYDVGHQAYAHKLLTGRRESFKKQRTFGGLSGFPNPMESEYDTFIAGHASNSISAALGMAIADKLTPGHENRKTVALIGDASISGGLAFEGLNNAANHPNDLLIILNDNEMSIDKNVGSLHRYLSELSTSLRYNKLRKKLYDFFRTKGYIGDQEKGRILRFNNSLKALISNQQNIFEGLNIRYFGPFDGNDVTKVVKVLQEIKNMTGPRILHLHTVKGKGYDPAEKNPTTWHAPGKFCAATGERIKGAEDGKKERWQEVFGKYLVKLAGTHDEIVGITAAMPSGTSMIRMMDAYPQRTFDVGISEGHSVTFAGGLAAAGKHPFVALYSSFLQRAYDNVIHDVCIQNLPVTFCIDRAGLVGEDGVTHHGLFDLVYLRCIPNLTVAAPMDAPTLRSLMLTALGHPGPMAIRYPRGNAPAEVTESVPTVLPIGRSRMASRRDGARAALLTIGEIGNEAAKAAIALQADGILVDHIDMIWLKPIDEKRLEEVAADYKVIVTVEDGSLAGGFGEAVTQWLDSYRLRHPDAALPYHISLGIPDRWIAQGSVAQLRGLVGIDAEAIAKAVNDGFRICGDTLIESVAEGHIPIGKVTDGHRGNMSIN